MVMGDTKKSLSNNRRDMDQRKEKHGIKYKRF